MTSELRETPVPISVWGKEQIEESAIQQMESACLLPIAVRGALMPDAHIGYGLPIGGVLATENCVIPYAVGVDIACRMRLTVYESKPIIVGQQPDAFKKALINHTLFGAGRDYSPKDRNQHEVMDDKDWEATWLLRKQKDKAYAQLGTSGSGNHFVEWGQFNLSQDDETSGLKSGSYLALLSHSGSRGVGHAVADYYSELAQQLHPSLPNQVKNLGWLSLDDASGQEYWLSMELAGRFAAANHEVIHKRLTKAMGLKVAFEVENHHNFAWKEMVDGKPVVVHRKGATPAAEGVLGIIPGSMGDEGYIVRGKGNDESMNSAAHGAGRLLSRKKARESITRNTRDTYLKERGITLLGGDLDESPQAYKPIAEVIAAQSDLIDIIGAFKPLIVRMDGR
jgi:tRNA-splicing ligase RtcB (3'-phosphate/5'-hydroxy nucleic acid ligase)